MAGKKSKRAGERKLPKHVGGLKLPKELRKAGGALLEKANSPIGRELIAAGLTMAATVASAAASKERTRRAGEAPRPPHAPAPPPKAANATAADPHEIGVALGKMAESLLSGVFGAKAKG